MSTKRVIQFLKYAVGGSIYFWSGYIVFAVCFSGFGWPWWSAKIVADIVGWTLNYFVQRYWAFSSSELNRHENRNRLRYGVFSVLNLGLDYAIVGGLQAVGVTPYIGMFVSAGFFTAWNYIGYRYWVFPEVYNKAHNHERHTRS